MKKQDLYSSLSVVALALMITACGDTTTAPESGDVDPASSSVPVSDSSVELSNQADDAIEESSLGQKNVDEVATFAASVAGSNPLFGAFSKALQNISAKRIAVAKAFRAAATAKTYDALFAARAAYETAYVAWQESVGVVKEAQAAFKASAESAQLVAQLKTAELQKAERTFEALQAPTNYLVSIDAKIKDLNTKLNNLQTTYILGTSPSNALKKYIEVAVSKLKIGDLSAGKVNFIQTKIEGADVYGEPLQRREMIINFFKNGDNQLLVKAGDLAAVRDKIYSEIVGPRLAIEFKDGSGVLGGGTGRYTIAELRAAIAVEGTPGDTTVAGLNGKRYPKFVADATPSNGGKPTAAYLDGLQDAFDKVVKKVVEMGILENDGMYPFFQAQKDALEPAVTALALSSGGVMRDMSGMLGFSDARRLASGKVNAAALNIGGVNGGVLDVAAPVFVQLQGTLSTNKTAEAALGSVAYRMGDTVIGAIQGYATEGVGFTSESRQLETSVMVSQNLGAMFVEGQVGVVSAEGVHGADWSGLRSHVRVGMDTAYASPFVELSHRNLSKDSAHQLNETIGSLGLEVGLGSQTAHNYNLSQKLFGKVGYGSEAWSTVGGSHLGDVSTPHASIQWSSTLSVSGGVGFSTNLGLSSSAGASLAVSATLDR